MQISEELEAFPAGQLLAPISKHTWRRIMTMWRKGQEVRRQHIVSDQASPIVPPCKSRLLSLTNLAATLSITEYPYRIAPQTGPSVPSLNVTSALPILRDTHFHASFLWMSPFAKPPLCSPRLLTSVF